LAPKTPGRKHPSHPGKPSRDVPGLPARRIAAEAVRRAIRERRPLDEALALAAGDKPRLEGADLGLARAIATVTFRRMGTIRAAITERLTGDALPDSGILREAMMTGAAQILFMDVPDHAAVDLAVELAKADRLALHYANFANAILRRIARDKAQILASSEASVADTPEWLLVRWTAAYGETDAHAIAAMHRMQPNIDLTAFGNRVTGSPAALAEAVGGRLLPTGSVRLETSGAVTDLPGFEDGAFQVQDAASALPARLVGAKAGQRILDLCAAPGGKTAQLVHAGGRVTAVERSAQRGERLTENLARLGLAADLVIADAGAFEAEPFDGVLLDAPCSATGTIRRHPEIAWTKRLEDILALARQQQRLLAHAAGLVKPGGTLVYSTCSLEPEEGEKLIRKWLETTPGFTIQPISTGELGVDPRSVTSEGFLRVLPCHLAEHGGMDGFFAARLHRVS
jgi:16S rRNA (cytosine967-C5)-methyltransferase